VAIGHKLCARYGRQLPLRGLGYLASRVGRKLSREGAMRRSHKFEMDELDHAIFEQLQEDGRKPFARIGRELGISINAVRARYRRMIENGALRIISIMNPRKMGYEAFASIYITVDPKLLTRCIEQIMQFPEVTWLAEMSGVLDLAIDVCCRDMDHLHSFVTQKLHKVEGIRETQTAIYFKVHKAFSLPMYRSLWEK
jgi:Lrp/AsnC family transcriptional regulator for asnA, asnC and gidA